MTSTIAQRIDVRDIAAPQRHARIFASLDALAPGQALELLHDHDPQPLRAQLDARAAGRFGWRVLEQGPSQWRVQIERLKPVAVPVGADSCCSGGACCG